MSVQNLKGLNSLRFFAALFVVIFHVDRFLLRSGYDFYFHPAFLNKSYSAVSFFFSLSGFLITYLLLNEQKGAGKINIKNFYLRRMLRIWPLYFLVVIIGLLLYFFVIPHFHLSSKTFSHLALVSVLFLFFLPNLVNNLFAVGPTLNITWSIGIEEQFYLIWAPLISIFKKNTLQVMIVICGLSFILMIANVFNVFHLDIKLQYFVYTYQFHYLAAGGIFAWLAVFRKEALVNSLLFRSKPLQLLLFALVFFYFFLYPSGNKNIYVFFATEIILCFLFPWLIVNISFNTLNIIRLDNKVFDKLGNVSYGIYMYHMLPLVFLGYFLKRFDLSHYNSLMIALLFYSLVILLTILVSFLSYRFFEKKFLKLKGKFM